MSSLIQGGSAGQITAQFNTKAYIG